MPRDIEDRVLTAIHALYDEDGTPSTFREIQGRVTSMALSSVYHIVVKLAERGVVEYTPGARRSVIPAAAMSYRKRRQVLLRDCSYQGRRGHLVFEHFPAHDVCPRCGGFMVTDREEPYCLHCGHREFYARSLHQVRNG